MVRQVVLDTETTGLDWRAGHRVIEIGCVELLNRHLSGRHFHTFINPERDIDPGAEAVHGISAEFLEDKPTFKNKAQAFLDFIRDAELIIHNAPFDVGFLDYELGLQHLGTLKDYHAGVIDTLRLAKEMNPGKKASLDALCQRYEIDNKKRTFHGALLDAELLADVYLAMTRGQDSLSIAFEEDVPTAAAQLENTAPVSRSKICVLQATAEELAAHEAVLNDIAKANKGNCAWLPNT